MKIGIIDCGGANLNSIYYSFKRINIKAFISNSLSELKKMDAFILPGVGSAGIVMNKLKVLRLRLRSRRENIVSSRQFEVIDVRQTHKMTANS